MIELLSKRLRRQAAWCAELDSPFYASLLESAADDLEAEGPVLQVLAGFEEEPGTAAVALRLMGAVHRLVLDDTLPELARHYPSTGGDGDPAAAWPVFRRSLIDHRSTLRDLLRSGCQTNEVGRSAALVGGFLEVGHRSRLPLRILEVGASAGLNLRWDRYRYESAVGAWGDASSPVHFTHAFEVPPPLNRTAEVVERKGCDLNPIDPTSDQGALTLRSFVWADQLGRLAQLDGAIEIAARTPAEVERLGAAEFLERELARSDPRVATVVFHSVFTQYVSPAERERIGGAIERAEVFHLSFEPGERVEARFEVRLNGELLGTSLAHGTGVRWLATPRRGCG
ncbi:MAG TPA: DUF2332 domain-containing protein [Candidatus Dormibacteraeota bacterium]|nr:DUF2332 domain-containing protein [Candidatus Dormibacteraeota bacterium]